MKRPEQHETDSAGKRLLRTALESIGWTLNESKDDYGWDFDVEIFSRGLSTGFTFKVQLKSSRSTEYSAKETFVSESLEADSARYLALELSTPVALVHADVERGVLYWTTPQLDTALNAKLTTKTAATVTVRIPTANRLPDTVQAFVQALARCALFLSTKWIADTPVTDFLAGMTTGPKAEERRAAFVRQAEMLKLTEAHQLFLARRVDEALAVVTAIASDPSATIEARFQSALREYDYRLYTRRKFGATPSMSDVVSVGLASQQRLRSLVKTGPPHLKLYALIRNTGLSFNALVERDWGLSLNWQVRRPDDDPFWQSILLYKIAENERMIGLKYRQLARLADIAVHSEHAWALGEALAVAARAVISLVTRLHASGDTRAADRFRRIALNWCKLVETFGRRVGDGQAVGSAILAAASIPGRTANDEISVWIRSTVDELEGDLRAEMTELLAKVDALGPIPDAPQTIDEEFEIQRQIYRNMAESVGIDLEDATDPAAEAVRIGLRDLDPSRVLRQCEYIFLKLGPAGLATQWLKMPTAGTKIVHCTKHGLALGAPDLDTGYAVLKARYCDSCPELSPRPRDWKYSYQWQEEQNKAFEARTRRLVEDAPSASDESERPLM